MPQRAIGYIIRERRLELGLTQEILADRVGAMGDLITQADISRIETGQVQLPRPARLQRIAAALGLSIGELLIHASGVDESGRLLIELPDESALADGQAAGIAEPDWNDPDMHLRLLENVEQAVIICDPDGTIRYWNAYSERLYGWSAEEAIGRTTRDVIVSDEPQWQQQSETAMRQIATGKRWSGPFDVRRRDGTRLMVQVVLSPVLDSDGNIVAVFGSSHEIASPESTASGKTR